jgi:hypothetical protein
MGCRSAFHVKAAEALWEFNRSSGQLPVSWRVGRIQ